MKHLDMKQGQGPQLLAVALGLVLMTLPVAAIEGPVTCTAALQTALEAQGLTCVSGEALFVVRVHATADLTTEESVQLLVDAYANAANYQPTVPCEAVRAVDDVGVLVKAGPGDVGCDAGALGQTIANPQTAQDVAKLLMRERIVSQAVERQRQIAVEAAQNQPTDKPGVRGGPPR